MTKTNLDDLNKSKTVIAITSFPNPHNGHKGKRDLNAMGWHSEKTLTYLSQYNKVLVFAEEMGTNKHFSIGKNLFVHRFWKKGNIFSLIHLCLYIIDHFKLVKNIYVPFEFNVFGGIIPNMVLLGILAILRMSGKQIVFELHQVIFDLKPVEKHVNIVNPLLQKFYNLGLHVFYQLLGLISQSIIVFEEELKIRLSGVIKQNKIHVLPLGIMQKPTLPIAKAKKLLKISKKTFVVMVFGFINGYKGIDWIIDAFSKTKSKNICLMIAGGKNPYLRHMPYYKQLYKTILSKIHKDKRIVHTGFIPDSKVGLYYSASDLTVLPYTVFMSASGPFSLGLSYHKPVILSDVLSDYAKSKDFKSAMTDSGLKHGDLFFPLETKHFAKLIHSIKTSKTSYKKLVLFSKLLAEKRSMDYTINQYKSLFDATDTNKNPGYSGISPLPPLLSVK